MVFSMIFDLATLAIAFMAFTSTATAQQNGQVNVYNLTGCNPVDYVNTYNGSLAGSLENHCKPECSLLVPNGHASIMIFSTNSINPTICLFYSNPTFFESGSCGTSGIQFDKSQSSQVCETIPTPPGAQAPAVTIGMLCYTSDCPLE
jgi:hypothetical protein